MESETPRAGWTWIERSGTVAVLLFAWSLPTSLFGMQAGAGLGISILLIWTARQREWGRLRTPLDAPIAWLLVSICLSLLLASRPPSSFRTATSFWVLISFWTTFGLLRHRRTLRSALVGILILACGACALGVYQGLTGHFPLGEWIHPGIDPLLKPVPGRPDLFSAVGLFFSRLTFAHVLLFPLCWALGLTLERLAWRWRFLAGLATFTLLVGLVATWTRAAWMAAAVCCVFLVVARLPRDWPRRSGFAALAVAAGIALLVLPQVSSRMGQAFAGKKDWGRLAIWQVALDLAAEQPLTGIGYGNFQRDARDPVEQRRQEMGAKRFRGTLAWAHNNLLTFLAEAGALGLVAFCWLFVAYFRAAGRRLYAVRGDPLLRGFLRGSMAAVAAFLLVGLFHDTFFDGEVIFCLWFTMGSSLAVDRWAPEREAQS